MTTPDHLAAQADEIAHLRVAVPARRRAKPKLPREMETMAAQMDRVADKALWEHGIKAATYANVLRWAVIELRKDAQRQRQGVTT